MIALCVYRDVSGMFTTESRAAGARDELALRGHAEAETLIQDIRWAPGGDRGVAPWWWRCPHGGGSFPVAVSPWRCPLGGVLLVVAVSPW